MKGNSLNREDIKSWLTNLRVFAMPLIVIYLTPIVATLTTPGHVMSLNDFALNSLVVGALLKYLLDALLGLGRKYYQTS